MIKVNVTLNMNNDVNEVPIWYLEYFHGWFHTEVLHRRSMERWINYYIHKCLSLSSFFFRLELIWCKEKSDLFWINEYLSFDTKLSCHLILMLWDTTFIYHSSLRAEESETKNKWLLEMIVIDRPGIWTYAFSQIHCVHHYMTDALLVTKVQGLI